ncbi:MAG: hypothetical protein QOD84_2790 [Acidobacteriaceae bacterium]|jgi:hypothetical protein
MPRKLRIVKLTPIAIAVCEPCGWEFHSKLPLEDEALREMENLFEAHSCELKSGVNAECMNEIARAFTLLSAIRQNLPNKPEIPKSWVTEFHSVLQNVEKSTGLSMEEFRVSPAALHKEILAADQRTGAVYCLGETVVNRSEYLLKIDAALDYFTNQKKSAT